MQCFSNRCKESLKRKNILGLGAPGLGGYTGVNLWGYGRRGDPVVVYVCSCMSHISVCIIMNECIKVGLLCIKVTVISCRLNVSRPSLYRFVSPNVLLRRVTVFSHISLGFFVEVFHYFVREHEISNNMA